MAGAQESAAAFIQNLGSQAIHLLGPGVPPALRLAEFHRIFGGDVDMAGASQFIRGPGGRTVSPEQQREFQALFTEYLAKAYEKKLSRNGAESFRVIGSHPIDAEMIVKSEAGGRTGKPVEIDWHVLDRDGRYLIADVDVDGVSLKSAHRSEFAAIIQGNGGRQQALFPTSRQGVATGRPGAATGSGSSLPPASSSPPADATYGR